eukprot:scaffold1999_cov119-Isochrysis_galbana.AAC.6
MPAETAPHTTHFTLLRKPAQGQFRQHFPGSGGLMKPSAGVCACPRRGRHSPWHSPRLATHAQRKPWGVRLGGDSGGPSDELACGPVGRGGGQTCVGRVKGACHPTCRRHQSTAAGPAYLLVLRQRNVPFLVQQAEE